MTRIGKIARLPRQLREELNRRLSDGEVGKRLVEWLNTLPEVQAVLVGEFGGRPINEQNLSDWKQGGFEDWQAQQEARAWVGQLVEDTDDLVRESGPVPLADRVAVPVLLALHQTVRLAATADHSPEQRRTILSVAHRVAQLCRTQQQSERVRIERECWEQQQAEAREKKQLEVERAARWARIKVRHFPDLDEDGFPSSNFPAELRACLAANARLQQAQLPLAPQDGSR